MSTLLQAQAELQAASNVYEFDVRALETLILKDLNLTAATARVEFVMGTCTEGYGTSERDVRYLSGVRVTSSRPATAPAAPYMGGLYGDK